MGNVSTSNYSGNRTFTATDPTDFDGCDPILVEIGASANEVIPLATVGNRIGVFENKLNSGAGDNGDVNIRLLNAGGTVRIKTSGAVSFSAGGTAVQAAVGGTVISGTTNQVGLYFGPSVSSGAIIEVLLD